MEQVFVWRKAVIGSLGFHIIAAVALGVIGYHMSQMAAAEAYEIDLSIPVASGRDYSETSRVSQTR